MVRRMSIFVFGSINTDLVLRAPRLPGPGETVIGGRFFQCGGGKGANQAVAAARLSATPVVLVAAVGDDALGRQALESLARERLDCRWVKRIAGQASGVAVILVDDHGENAIAVAEGANAGLLPDDVDAIPAAMLGSCRVALVSLEIPLPTAARALDRCRWAGTRVILNPAPAAAELRSPALLSLVDVLTPNEHEAALLAQRPVRNPEEALAAGRALQSLGCRSCVITLGAQGCLVVESDARHIPALPVAVRDTTAAGDAFNGALAVALCGGATLVDAAAWATRAAAHAVGRDGAQTSLPTLADLASGLEHPPASA
jgi:ribokinase